MDVLQVRPTRRAGYTLIELSVSVTLFVVILLSSLALMERDTHLSRSTLSITDVERSAIDMLYKLEHELADALITVPVTTLRTPVGTTDSQVLEIGSSVGFPQSGFVILDRGLPSREVVEYTNHNGTQDGLTALTRGMACTTPAAHAAGPDVIWAGMAVPILLQVNPPASTWDGRARGELDPVFYRGSGTGISFRVPVDPAGGNDFLDGDDVQWGAVVNGVPTLNDGWCWIEYVPADQLLESATQDDLNRDGDFDDVFDVGQLRRRIWDASNPAGNVQDLGLGPRAIIQEQCNWGSDLDGDGFEDPMFLWDPTTRQLHIRLFVVGRGVREIPIVRKVESLIFQRNENDNGP